MTKKENNSIIIVLVSIIIILSLLLILFFTGVIKFNDEVNVNNNFEEVINDDNVINNSNNSNDSKEDNVNNQNKEDNVNDKNIDINELKYNGKSVVDGIVEDIIINRGDSLEIDYDFLIYLTVAGKIKVVTIDEDGKTTYNYLSNVENVIDIIHFTIPGVPNEQLVYMLLENGDVYYYRVGDSIDKKYIATKVENIAKVKKIFTYTYEGKPNSGGSWDLVAITEENECITLNQERV